MKIIVWLLLSCSALLAADRDPLLDWLDGIAQKQLAERSAAIQQIHTVQQAQARNAIVRKKILDLLGGLPDYNGPLQAKITGAIDRPQYVIEKILFQSLPGLYVTGNLYRPKTAGKHPGILIPLGHWEEGKPAVQLIAANLVRKGFVVFTYDPIGQGERLQAYDWRMNGALAGQSTEQHLLAGAQSLLVGQSFARYRIWDGKRALDYLVSRPEVDAERIGCTGCSGGGTLTTYLSALDARIKVAAPTCYMNSFRTLFAGPVGDSEQSLPNFISAGLDQSDYVELFAPKPWLMGSTEKDFFPLEGARQVYNEANRWYEIYGAPGKIKWVVGPGGHGTPLVMREAIYEWMIRWLNNGQGDSKELPVDFAPDDELLVTAGGQVAKLPGSRDIYEFIRDTPHQTGTRQELKQKLLEWTPSDAGPDLKKVTIQPAVQGSARKPAYVLVETRRDVPGLAERLVRAGYVVARVVPRGFTYGPAARQFSGEWLPNVRALLIGQNLPGLRARDILQTVDELGKRSDVDPKQIRAFGPDLGGIWLLMAAALDERISKVWLDRTPYSLRAALDDPISMNLHDAVLPGFAIKWDLSDLTGLIGEDKVIWTDPTDWVKNVVRVKGRFRYRNLDANTDRSEIPADFLP